MTETATARPPWLARWCPNAEWVLLVVLALEISVFGLTAPHFFTTNNAFDLVRQAAEIGLLVLGLTPVIKTGGIDLSVASMMGLAAVVLGGAWSVLGLPLGAALVVTLLLGAAGGAFHGLLITRLRVPPLIVTLGTFSLYRGLAEAMTGGYASYSGFPTWFLNLGQGRVAGWVPAQLPLFAAVFAGLWLMLHRAKLGREIAALGFNAAGARFAGVRVNRVLVRAYVICGLCSALAGLIYVARIGQAKADAGFGYELPAIAAVVLGGTSIMGGRGTLHGSLLGLLCLVVLQNGLRLAGEPEEIAGLGAGLILLVAIILNQSWTRMRRTRQISLLRPSTPLAPEEFHMKNSQIALLVAAMFAAALLVAGSNWWLVRSLRSVAATRTAPAPAKLTIAVTPKTTTDPYFVTCKEGADEAARELDVNLLWNGPITGDPAAQNEIVNGWITKGVDVIAGALVNPAAISSVLRKAQNQGITVLTWDSDAEPDAREFFVNQATAEGIGSTLADEGARLADGQGQYAIITATLTDTNQNEWIKAIKARMAAAHPGMTLATIHPCDGQRDKAMTEARNIVQAYPGVKVLIAICSPAVPGAAEALKQADNHNVKLTGLSTPNLCRDYLHEGWVQSIVLWNTRDLGYLTVYASAAAREGRLKRGDTSFTAGRLGPLKVDRDQILLGQPLVFTTANIDQFHF
ncbi:substrate-binding domain-containing protein [Horticoccus luteus]|uniref:Autoinducer 2 import system permease protein LsrD n=1 Tax=Horticoccus luteus TaxID=2862869 RepID=A0A8F9TRM6_9BACT|nr:substrate-binding domain-containing protein [Horticoccus luteus]QYM77745.1 substrate-binding domain-containing protein [Horticoccus luteus]